MGEARQWFITTSFLFFLLALVVGMLIGNRLINRKVNEIPKAIINGKEFIVEISDTPERITQGLSGRTSMARDRGMLFAFDNPVNHQFWMNEMKFNLDFVFTKDCVVVDLVENVLFPKDNEQPQSVIPKSEYNMVLELNSGIIKETGIKIGDKITLTGEKFSQ